MYVYIDIAGLSHGGFIILEHLGPLHHSELCQLHLLRNEQPGTAWAEDHSPPGGLSGSLPVQESGNVSCLPLTVGLVVRAVKCLCFFLLHFPLVRQFSPNSAPLPFAEGSSPTTSLQETLWETTLQRVPCHVPSHQTCPASPCPWGCLCCSPQEQRAVLVAPQWAAIPAASTVPHAARVSSSHRCCFVLRLMLLCL